MAVVRCVRATSHTPTDYVCCGRAVLGRAAPGWQHAFHPQLHVDLVGLVQHEGQQSQSSSYCMSHAVHGGNVSIGHMVSSPAAESLHLLSARLPRWVIKALSP